MKLHFTVQTSSVLKNLMFHIMFNFYMLPKAYLLTDKNSSDSNEMKF